MPSDTAFFDKVSQKKEAWPITFGLKEYPPVFRKIWGLRAKECVIFCETKAGCFIVKKYVSTIALFCNLCYNVRTEWCFAPKAIPGRAECSENGGSGTKLYVPYQADCFAGGSENARTTYFGSSSSRSCGAAGGPDRSERVRTGWRLRSVQIRYCGGEA